MKRRMSSRKALSLSLLLGVLIGVILGVVLGDLDKEMILGVSLGLLIGLVIGVLIDAFRRDKVEHRITESDVVQKIAIILDESTREDLYPVVKSVEGALTLDRSVLGLVPSGLKFLYGPPDDWPENVAWKPRRYFGPFREGSDISQIKIFVQGPSTIRWYYNDYFSDCPDAPKYTPFYPGQNLPNQKLADIPTAPGYMPAADGAGKFVCSLDMIAYSSRYGGTVELTFKADYDVGFEIRLGQYIWDLKDLELRIYVAPTTAGYQNPGIAYNQGSVSCDILSSEQICYRISADGDLSIQALDDVNEGELTQALVLLSQEIVNHASPDARRFVAGYLSSLFPELLAPNMIVESINISDNFIDPITRQGIPYVTVRYRVSDISAASGWPSWLSSSEFRVTLESWYVLNNELQAGPARIFELEENEDTSWMFAGQWSLENEIPYLDFIVLRLSGVEVDTLSPDNVFETFELRIELDQSELVANHNANNYGLIDEGPEGIDRFITEFSDASIHVFFNMNYRVYLGLR